MILLQNNPKQVGFDFPHFDWKKGREIGIGFLKQELSEGENFIHKLYLTEGEFTDNRVHELYEFDFIAVGNFVVDGKEHSELHGKIRLDLCCEDGEIFLNKDLL